MLACFYVSKQQHIVISKGENSFTGDHSECEGTEDVSDTSTRTRRKRQSPLIEDLVTGE